FKTRKLEKMGPDGQEGFHQAPALLKTEAGGQLGHIGRRDIYIFRVSSSGNYGTDRFIYVKWKPGISQLYDFPGNLKAWDIRDPGGRVVHAFTLHYIRAIDSCSLYPDQYFLLPHDRQLSINKLDNLRTSRGFKNSSFHVFFALS